MTPCVNLVILTKANCEKIYLPGVALGLTTGPTKQKWFDQDGQQQVRKINMQTTSFSEVRGSSRSFRPSYDLKRDWMLPASIAALTVAFLVFTVFNNIMPTGDDVELYYQYANRVLGGSLPYRDFNIEYPPFSLIFFILPAIISNSFGAYNPERYILLFQAESFLLAVATLILVWQLLRTLYPVARLNWRLAFFTAATILICLYVFRRFDISATFLVTLSFYLLYKQRQPGWGGAVLGLATAAKLFPAVLLPIMLIYYWRGKRDRDFALRTMVGFGMAVGVTVLPFVITGLPGLLAFLKYHGERGVQVESLFASLIWLGSIFGLTNIKSSVDHGSINFVSSWGQTLATTATLLTVAGLLAFFGYLWWATRQSGRRLRVDWMLQAGAIAILWFILSNKVLSPQYLVWLLPFAAFWRGPKIWLYFAALTLSFIAFPFMVLGVVAVDWQPMLVILLRNLLLVGLFGLQVWDFVKGTVNFSPNKK